MKDSFGREISYLRVSVTRRCNLNCVYCGKEDCDKRSEELGPADIHTIVRAFAKTGINKVRITGGEPLVRRDICRITKLVSSVPGIETVALTTNGVYLADYAEDLKEAGLQSVNISLDSTDGATYRRLTGADVLAKVLAGIDEAERAGLSPIKINAVLMRGVNADGAGELIALAKNKPVDVRFIELMPFSDAGDDKDLIVTGDDILKDFPFLEPAETEGTAKYYTAPGFKGRVGFINSISGKFCSDCSRIRLLADGCIKPCLGRDDVYNLKPFLKDENALLTEIKRIIRLKPAGHDFDKTGAAHGLNRTGG